LSDRLRVTVGTPEENSAMLAVFKRGGFPMQQRHDGGVIHVTLELKAVPEGFRPTITPQQAYDIAWDQPIAGQMHRTLAVTYDTYSGGDSRPDWVFIARRQCYPSAKGDLVSPARSGMVGKTCTDKNLALVSVDAETGKPAMAFVDEGERDRRPVLLLHGNPTWGFLYRDFVEPLRAAGYRVVVPDWIGSGYSDHPRVDAALTLAHHIADLVSLIDQLSLRGFVLVAQDWGGPQGVGAALERRRELAALVLMNTWLFTDTKGKFHQSPLPWTTWHAPIIGQLFMKRLKVLSHGGVSAITRRGMTETEKRAYHHVFDEPDSDHVVLTWPRTIPLRAGDRGSADMATIQRRLPGLHDVPTLLVWAREIPSLDPLTEGIIERIHILSHHISESMSETLAEFHLDRRWFRVLGRLRSYGPPYQRSAASSRPYGESTRSPTYPAMRPHTHSL
jgi:haloalkane dehalogenase